MHGTAPTTEILVRENRPLRLRRAATVRCTAGTVWITSTGEKRDFFLSSGQSRNCPGNGQTLIEGIGEAWICLEENCRPALGSRIGSAARRLWARLFSRTGRAASATGWYV